MPFGAHETMEVHEVLCEKINLINHFGMYIRQAQNPQLREMIERQMQAAMQAYDEMVAYTHDYDAAHRMSTNLTMPHMNANPGQIQYGLHQPEPHMPNPQATAMNDAQIAGAVLIAHKASAKCHMAAALECADANVRRMMINGAVICADQAYETFLFMNQQGLYQVPTMKDHTAKTFLHAYQPMGQQSQMMHNQQMIQNQQMQPHPPHLNTQGMGHNAFQ